MFEYKFYWESDGRDGARLLRAYGEQPHVRLPDTIEGLSLTEIGPYCFAKESRLPQSFFTAGCRDDMRLHELSGSYIKTVILPDTVKKIGSLAFYNCSSLTEMEMGSGLVETGSDVFMNGRNFHRLKIRGSAKDKSGAAQIAALVSSDLLIEFGAEETEAVVLFPEYSESYDEIAPAHIFGRNIEGEGFRARQCFKDGVLDFRQYDAVFRKACTIESADTLCEMALNRLTYPIDLEEDMRAAYLFYVRAHAWELCRHAVEKKDTALLEFFCQQKIADRKSLEEAICLAAHKEWAQGAAFLFSLKEKYMAVNARKGRYQLDDWQGEENYGP